MLKLHDAAFACVIVPLRDMALRPSTRACMTVRVHVSYVMPAIQA